ncbi:MAG: type I restriction-modification system subunit M [Ignavibacteriales bacterium]|nr:type I restriction-modification system subunit M [Ignavibacteriales bacterium]MCF8306515.1 type I restriction-modification system subunit M [Ignavibacteriales bacterium]MCF8316314.1 type I restriction-modification system subunit M [Ignavibacteriales bacterium]MCF8437728.1 type I restriction-modification system subunit M [Ignavibacteriales bacterium]
MLQNNAQLKSLIDKLWQNFWEGGIANPLTAIEQITYLIFMKRLDDLEAKRERDAEWTGEKYVSRFAGKFNVPGSNESIDKNELRWSVFKHKPADEMLLHVQMKVFPFLKEINSLNHDSNDSGISVIKKNIGNGKDENENHGNHENQINQGSDSFTRHMANAVFIMPKASLLVSAINIVEDIFKEIEKDATEGGHAFQDIQGDVYEMLLSEIATAGKNGQFRTPRHIIKLMAELVAPQLGQRIADPACGTGGFLLGAYQYILTDLVRKNTSTSFGSAQDKSLSAGDRKPIEKDEDGFERAAISAVLTQNVKTILDQSFVGYDIDTTMVRLGLMNLMMHGIDEPKIDYKDTLSKSYNEDSQFDVIMANPPFTGNIDKGDINEGLKLPTTKTELLFVERIFNMLKMGGTAAVIVPSGVIQNSGKAFESLRKLIIEKAELKAVIAVPSGAFKPYAGVSTAILIFTKGGETNNVWFYDMQSDGYSLDDKRNKIADLPDGTAGSDLPDIVQRFKERGSLSGAEGDRKQKYFMVPKNEIVENNYDLNLSTYKEEVYEEVVYEKPNVIFVKLESIEADIQKGLAELKQII